LTVIIIFTGVPGHELAVGVTIYVTVPAADPGFVRPCEIVEPDDAIAPVIPPVIVPIVQLKVAPATLLVSAILVVSPLQIVVGLTVVTFGVGFTVTIISTGVPGHELAVGVTLYVTVPGVVPGLTSIWAIVEPLDALAPVTPPVTPAIVQLKVAPATLLINAMFVDSALHIVVALVVETFGVGLTVMVKVCGVPSHVTRPLVKCGVTAIEATTGAVPAFIAANAAILPVPDAPSPILVLSFVQV